MPLLAATLLASTSCGRRADVGAVVVSVIGGTPTLAGRDRSDLPSPDRLLTDSVAEGLVRLDAGGQIEAGVAERWIVTEEGRSYIFRLRQATWPDGRAVRASDVVRLLRRQLAPGSANRIAPYLSAVSAIVEMTPEVIEIELSRPRPDLLKLFAQPELALLPARMAGGAGPFRHQPGRGAGTLLTPANVAGEDGARPEDDVRLIGERASRAIVRFVERGSDLVSGGTLTDWPVLQAANPAPANVRIDPAAGLFGLAVARRDGFLADPANRAAVAMAIDRAELVRSVSPEWPAYETLLPEQLDSAIAPAFPSWSAMSPEERQSTARARVATWRAAHGIPLVGVALPDGAGGTQLWGRIARDLYAIGIRPLRLAIDAPDADLRLVDQVAPYDGARWYLAEACVACSEEARAEIEAARVAETLEARARAIAAADTAMARDAAFVPLARPFRWSLVSLRLRQWQPNARAWHPLNRLRVDTN